MRYVIQLFGITDDNNLSEIFPNSVNIWVGRNDKAQHMGYGYVEFCNQDEITAAMKYIAENLKGLRSFIIPPNNSDDEMDLPFVL